MGQSDAAYRRLFQHRELLRDLFACVLDEQLLLLLDWDGMEPVPTSLVSDRLRQRVGDGAWRIPYRKAGPATSAELSEHLYVLLLFEHQSQPDTVMALRLMVYAGLLYESLLRGRHASLPLPPVLPVVFYSGTRAWNASVDLSALIGDIPADLRPYQPQMRYLLLEERKLMQNAGLPDDNLATLLFRFVAAPDLEQWQGLLHTLIRAVRGPEHEELNRSLTAWLLHLVQRNASPPQDVPRVNTLQELDMMITEKPGVWARQWKKEGVIEGQADLLLRQIQRRFGPVPDIVSSRIRTANSNQLETWSLNFVDASNLNDVFRD